MKKILIVIMLFIAPFTNPMMRSPIIKIPLAGNTHLDQVNWSPRLADTTQNWQCLQSAKALIEAAKTSEKKDDTSLKMSASMEEMVKKLTHEENSETDDEDQDAQGVNCIGN